MLLRLEDGDIDWVIVHKVDRLARNRADDVTINLSIRKSGAALVSVTENIDETPSGTLLHGIMASISEFYSKNLAAEVSKGMDQKAKRGGRPGKAPVGYLNTREIVDGNEIRTIVPHPEHAEHVRWAFEAYSSGDYTVRTLCQALEERGLRTQHSRKHPPKPMNPSKVQYMLRNVFYVGIVEWKGEQYPGRHEPLVTPETWAQVQALMTERDQAAERVRTHRHYLKGTVFCARCQRRLGTMVTTGKSGGQYEYFFCLGRQAKNGCDLPFLNTQAVEEEVTHCWSGVDLGPAVAEDVRGRLLAALKRSTTGLEQERTRQQKRVRALDGERRRLVRAHLQGAVPVDILKEEQERLEEELRQSQQQLRAMNVDWDVVEANLTYALGLVSDCEQAYRRGGPRVRRSYNQAFFEAIYVDAEGVASTRLASPFNRVLAPEVVENVSDKKNPDPRTGQGLSKNDLVGRKGLEPLTPCASCAHGPFADVRRRPMRAACKGFDVSGLPLACAIVCRLLLPGLLPRTLRVSLVAVVRAPLRPPVPNGRARHTVKLGHDRDRRGPAHRLTQLLVLAPTLRQDVTRQPSRGQRSQVATLTQLLRVATCK
jgi:DNA invertase Pin-like site-specific DNA recombinase